MAEEKRTETMIPQENSKEAAEVMGFMDFRRFRKERISCFLAGRKIHEKSVCRGD